MTNGTLKRFMPSCAATAAGAASSESQGEYLPPQELKSQSVSATSPAALRTNSGPLSRNQMSLSASRLKVMRSRLAPSSVSRVRASASASSSRTFSTTGSKRAMVATRPAMSARAASRWPSHSSSSNGHEVQVAACSAHSGGMRKPCSAGVFRLEFKTASCQRNGDASGAGMCNLDAFAALFYATLTRFVRGVPAVRPVRARTVFSGWPGQVMPVRPSRRQGRRKQARIVQAASTRELHQRRRR